MTDVTRETNPTNLFCTSLSDEMSSRHAAMGNCWRTFPPYAVIWLDLDCGYRRCEVESLRARRLPR